MESISIKLQELQLVSKKVPTGCHIEVAEKLNISISYCLQIRKGKNMTVDSEENRKFMQKMINEYRKLIKNEAERLAKI